MSDTGDADNWPTRRAEPSSPVQELADFYRYLAEAEFDGYCDLYARLARSIADDRDLLERITTMAPATKVLPILLNAAVHFTVLGEPDLPLAACYRGDADAPADPWPLFRDLVDQRFDELAERVASRTIQTNEVGRSSVLLPLLTSVHRTFDRPLSLIELGPSAGLNLFFDRFGYRYDDGRVLGDPSAGVQLTCAVVGDLRPPLDASPPPVRSRLGIDLAPVDITDPVSRRWLEACIWPQLTDRSTRLRAAMDLARTDPPDLHRGNALDLLADLVTACDPDTVVCVFATWVLAYFSHDQRAELGVLLDQLGTDRDLALVTSEYPSIAPFVDRPERPAAGSGAKGASVVGRVTWSAGVRQAAPVAWCHAHGAWIDWLDPATAEGPAPSPGTLRHLPGDQP
jgi:hypothetical protein